MIKLIRGMAILAGILLIFALITACAPNKAFVKNNNPDQGSRNINEMPQNDKNSEKYSYDEFENDSEFTYDAASSTKEDRNNSCNESNAYYQTGYASWYGREFHGRKTASGEKFDMNRLTAAHKKLPFGTQLVVKNLENGNYVNVTVNDRGPYRDGRIIDLSYAAARKLGILASGEAKVGISILGKGGLTDNKAADLNGKNSVVAVAYDEKEEDFYSEDENSTSSYAGDAYSIQAGAFYSRRNAERLQKKIEEIVDNPVTVFSENDLYKVRVNKIGTKGQASKIKSLLRDKDISSFVIENQE
ncbi:MAG: septal ring lytic transglycosylase RlpA family protein [Spirochaetes bacterium]|nr:septal ring lytic transglycosylase RlpA family protein [Spirochaetota bacterium]